MNKKLFLLPILALTLACLGTPSTPIFNAPSETSILPTQIVATLPGVSAEASVSAPAPQASGLKIAFVKNGNVWMWSQPTGARPLTAEGDASEVHLSSDGAVIAYQRGQTLWAVNADGSAQRLLVDVPSSTGHPLLAQFDFQPNSHTIFFSTRERPTDYYGVKDLFRIDANAPAPQSLLTDGGGYFTFSPDGNLLALTQLDRINVVHADGSALNPALTFTQINTGADWFYFPQIVWLADSTGFYTVIPARDIIANPAEKARFLYVSADGSITAQLAEFVAADLRITKPLIAPNGSKLTYVSQDAGGVLSIHVIDASTADAVVAAFPNAGSLTLWAWSPDSTRFAFWTRDTADIQLGGMNLPALTLVEGSAAYSLAWVTADTFLYYKNGELKLGQVGNPDLALIASEVSPSEQDARYYDFAQ